MTISLSLNKFRNVLISTEFIVKNIFSEHEECVYIELFNVKTCDSILVYIPSKYKIPTKSEENVYEISHMNISENGNIIDDYTTDVGDMDDIYSDINIPSTPSKHDSSEKFAKRMEENYDRPLSLINTTERKYIREIYRQLRRLALCVRDIKYKIAVCFKEYICCVDRNNEPRSYIVKRLKSTSERRFIVSIDLETLFEKLNTLPRDVTLIRREIQKILDKNQQRHMEYLRKTFEEKNILENSTIRILKKKAEYASRLNNLRRLLIRAQNSEEQLSRELSKHSETSLNLMKQSQNTSEFSKIKTKIQSLEKVKHDIITNLTDAKVKYDDISLKVDNIYFNLNVLAYEINCLYYQLSSEI